MKRKCPDCKKTEITSKEDRAIKKEWTKAEQVPLNTCFKCLKFYEEVDQERLTQHYRGG